MWGRAVASPLTPLAGATLRLFSKRGRLKTGPQSARLWPGGAADIAWPSATPAKPPVNERGEAGCARRSWIAGDVNPDGITQITLLDPAPRLMSRPFRSGAGLGEPMQVLLFKPCA